jgi:hypothetical protein
MQIGKNKKAAANLSDAVRPMTRPHSVWDCLSRFGVPWNVLAVFLILHCGLWVASGLASKPEEASKADSKITAELL